MRQTARVSIASAAPPNSRAGDRVAQPAGLAQLAHECLARGVDVLRLAAEMLRGPRVELAREVAMPRLEERPVEVLCIAHRPSNCGFRFATNAS